MRKIKTIAASLLCVVCLTVNLAFSPVQTEAVVLEATAAASLAEILAGLVLSFGATYMATEEVMKAKDAYDDWVNGDGAALYGEVMTDVKINCGYWAYVNGEMVYIGQPQAPEPSNDPDKTAVPDDPETGDGETQEGKDSKLLPKLLMVPAVIVYAKEFWTDYFRKESTEVPAQPRTRIQYDVPGAIGSVSFGSYVRNEAVENAFNSFGIAYLDGCMQVAYDGTSNYVGKYYSYYARFHKSCYENNPSYYPAMVINPYNGGNAYSITICRMPENGLFNGDYLTGTWGTNNYSEARILHGSYWDSRANYDSATFYPAISDLYGIYDCVPGSIVRDGIADKVYYWSGSRLYHRIYDQATGTYTDTPVQNGYIYTPDGVYRDLTDLYPETDGLDLIEERLKNIEDILKTLKPEEMPQIDYTAIEGLQDDLTKDKEPYAPDYPALQPDTEEVPSEYPEEVDETYRKLVEDNKPQPDSEPENDPSTNPDSEPENDPGTNPGDNSGNASDEDPNGQAGDGKLDKNDFALSLMDFFPFCLPRDLYLLIKTFYAPAEAPKFSWNIPTVDEDGNVENHLVVIDLSLFDDVALIFRGMECIMFVFGLVLVSRKIVKGG